MLNNAASGPVLNRKWKINAFEKMTFFECINFQIISSKKNLFVSSLLGLATNYGVALIRLIFYDYHDFQPKIRYRLLYFWVHMPILFQR